MKIARIETAGCLLRTGSREEPNRATQNFPQTVEIKGIEAVETTETTETKGITTSGKATGDMMTDATTIAEIMIVETMGAKITALEITLHTTGRAGMIREVSEGNTRPLYQL